MGNVKFIVMRVCKILHLRIARESVISPKVSNKSYRLGVLSIANTMAINVHVRVPMNASS